MSNFKVDNHGNNVHLNQHRIANSGDGHYYLTVPSDSTPAFNSQVNLTLREKGIILDNITLEITASAISGITGGTTAYLPATFWFSRIDCYMGSKLVETIFPEVNFVDAQLHHKDERRRYTNISMGDYNDASARQALTATQSVYYAELNTPFRQAKLPLVTQEDLQLRIFFKPIASCFTTTGTGTGTGSLSLLQAVVKYTKIDAPQMLLSTLNRVPRSFYFLETRNQSLNVQSGVTSTRQVLSGIQGKVSYLFFVIRADNSGNGATTFVDIRDFEILKNSKNIIGGTVWSSRRSKLHAGRFWTESSYLTEANSHVFLYCWCATPAYTATTGSFSGDMQFDGNEQLSITWASATPSNYVIDVYAKIESSLVLGAGGVTKKSL